MTPIDYGFSFRELDGKSFHKVPTRGPGTIWHVYYCGERRYNLRIFKARGVWQVRVWNSDSLEDEIDHSGTWEGALTNALEYLEKVLK